MSPPPDDLVRKIKDILRHTVPLAGVSDTPILHYRQTVNGLWDSLGYVERAFRPGNRRPEVVASHLGRLYGMSVIALVEAFERFLKEIAAACIDHLARHVADDRFDAFTIKGGGLAAHFGSGSPGRSLCESSTWLSCREVNDRFRAVLADPFVPGTFYLFPGPNQKPEAERWRYEPLSLVWQLRHTVVHNVGMITMSDAIKLQQLARQPVDGGVLLAPTRPDLRYLGQFLDDTADSCNRRVGERLAELLTLIHGQAPTLVAPQEVANRIAADFRHPVVVAGAIGVPPPD